MNATRVDRLKRKAAREALKTGKRASNPDALTFSEVAALTTRPKLPAITPMISR